ncbi:hypothetical protein Patl_2270 [Paraglaciecola sp. T6c]|uniref:hypothetical protein n=1 Tax=Pseudoalteromonas atlantica (strain T6c / ATCC BAA-1087) TaxID=3042615 RepID=UPI00005C63E5|nr:hypothetical protein [Paraglaciecola sp. T6c]ABG40787.1 hypothetical protein Patl_2270 [Paraglaciecola sp. T6c]
MEPDIDVANSKKQEVNQVLRSSLLKVGIEPDSTEELINTTLNPAISVRAPKKPISNDETDPNIGTNQQTADAIKPGNIKLSISTLIEHIERSQPSGFQHKQEPWLGIYAFIELLRLISDLQEVTISENDAMVIWCMWFVRARRTNTISGKDLLTKINSHLIRYERSALMEDELESSLKNLQEISAIRKSKNAADSWYLVGWVKRTY